MIDLRLLKKRNLATAILFNFVLGLVIMGTTTLIPQFLQNTMGYTAERAGIALMPGGLVMMLVMPIAAIACARLTTAWSSLLASWSWLSVCITSPPSTSMWLLVKSNFYGYSK
jgi:hypothetical protein